MREICCVVSSGGGVTPKNPEGSGPVPVSHGWTELASPGLWARALLIAREDVAFFKHLLESFEDVGLVRTAEDRGEQVILAVIAPLDFVGDADHVLADVEAHEPARFAAASLPRKCVTDWFLAEWSPSVGGSLES